VLRSVLPPNLLALSVISAAILGEGLVWFYADTPGKAVERAKAAGLLQQEAIAEARDPSRIPIRKKLDAHFARAFSPLFPGAAKENLCSGYPSFICDEIAPFGRPAIDGGAGSQQAGLSLFDPGKAFVTLTYSADTKGHVSEYIRLETVKPVYDYPTGNFPPALLKVELDQLRRLGVTDAMIMKCATGEADDENTINGMPFSCVHRSRDGFVRGSLTFSLERDGQPL
jgi:hypothetical protein